MGSNPPEKNTFTYPKGTKVIACATVIEEMLPLMNSRIAYHVMDFGLHINPEKLKKALQGAIDSTEPDIHTLVFGYGLCAQAVVGLESRERTLVVPRVDDCIGIFLGSDTEYKRQFKNVPGTYYLTKGWIEVGSSPFHEYEAMTVKYGEKRAQSIMGQILKNYKRLALINTGQDNMETYRNYTQTQALKFGLTFEEIPGSHTLITKMLFGPLDNDFVIIPPGNTIAFKDFKKS